MFAHLIEGLRQAGLPTSITEYLTLLGAMKAGVAEWSVDDFYYLSRATLVKDERHLDRFDRVFAQCFKGLEAPEGVLPRELPEEWLRKLAEKLLSPEEMAKIEALGGFEALMQRLARTAGGAEGAAPGRLEMDRHGGDVAVRRVRLQSGRRAHRPARIAPSSRGEGVGQARFSRPGRHAWSRARAT